MKGLLTTFGLLLALFFTFQSKADIYDIASYQAPKISNSDYYLCYGNGAVFAGSSEYVSYSQSEADSLCYSDYVAYTSTKSCYVSSELIDVHLIKFTFNVPYEGSCDVNRVNHITQGFEALFQRSDNSSSCPPDSFPNYLYDVDIDGDGQIDRCYEPNELDNLSNCSAEQGQMLNGSNSSDLKVCKTDSSSGVSCGYSRPSLDSGGFMLDLEMNCFGTDKDIPEYNNDPLPDPLPNCNSVNSQLQVCEADPLDRCRNQYDCDDQCGYVQGKFVCFSGSDQTTPPDETDKEDTDPTDTDTPIPADADIADLMRLTQDKSNGTIYAINQKSNQIISALDGMHKTLSDKLTLGKKANSAELQKVQDLLQKLVDKPNGGDTPEPEPEPEPEEPAPDAPGFSTELSDLAPTFDHAAIDAKIEQSEQSLKDRFFAIRTLFADTFSFTIGSGGSLPCLGTINYGGEATEICLTPYAEQINWIGLALVFGFTVFGFIIIFK